MKNFKNKIQKFIALMCMIGIIVGSSGLAFPKRAEAQFATYDAANFAQNTLTAISTSAANFHTFYLEFKESVLDGLAWILVKKVLQIMTADVVAWINSGFEGNPAFLTNPTGFLLDAVDETTGAFLSKGGPLANFLCSPFSLDIRLNLALGHVTPTREKYACTLSTVIKNVKDIPNNVTINGRNIGGTVEGFVGGDFYQGGWPAFIAMTTEPQNDIYGAYLGAHSDLVANAAQTRAKINFDLALGRGFLSWKKCDTLATATTDEEYAEAESLTEGDTTIEKKVSADGNSIAYKSCSTETPGSVISDTLTKQLGIPADQLNIADEVNEIVDALISRFVTDLLTSGLAGVTSSRPGNKPSVIEELRIGTVDDFEAAKARFLINVRKYFQPSKDYRDLRNQALALLTPELAIYDSAKLCLEGKRATASPYGAEFIDSTLEKLNAALDLAEATYDDYKFESDDADNRVKVLTEMELAATGARDVQTLLKISDDYSDLIVNQQLTDDLDVQQAKDDLKEAEKLADKWRREASSFLRTCNNLF